MSEDYILETEDMTKEFAGFVAVNGVTLRVKRGTIHALIGPNGAGKTTCFNLLTKFLQPTRGRITFNGRDITSLPPTDIARLGLVRFKSRPSSRISRCVKTCASRCSDTAVARSISGIQSGCCRPMTIARWRCSAMSGLRSSPS